MDSEQDSQQREMTFGEKAVGLTFNPSNNVEVQEIKEQCAKLIDFLAQFREAADTSNEQKCMDTDCSPRY